MKSSHLGIVLGDEAIYVDRSDIRITCSDRRQACFRSQKRTFRIKLLRSNRSDEVRRCEDGIALSRPSRSRLAWPTARRRLPQCDVRPVLVIVRQIFLTKPKVAFAHGDDVIDHLPANTADPSFRSSVLPRASHTRS